MRRHRVLVTAVFAAVAAVGAAAAQEPPRAEVRGEMRRLLEVRLKSEVGLDDRQIADVLPKIEAIEQARRQAARVRLGLLRDLRRGVESGAPDAELERALDDLDRGEQEVERRTREGLAGIDATLTVPQRVRLRFLLARFRGEMVRRVEEIVKERRGPGRRAR